MRILVLASVILFATALSLPSAACDRHGAGGFYGQFNGATWSDYSPPLSESEALFSEDELSTWEKENTVPSAATKPKKPTFSKVSSRASTAAKARLAAKAKLAKLDNEAAASASENTESSSAAAILNVGR